MSGNRKRFVIGASMVGAMLGVGITQLSCKKTEPAANPAAATAVSPAPEATPTMDGSTPYDIAKSLFNPLVVVGPGPKDLVPPNPLAISYKAQKPVTWRTLTAEGTLRIVFPEKKFSPSGAPAPFEDMDRVEVENPKAEGGKEWVFKFRHPFSANVELSGAVNRAIEKFFVDNPNVNELIYDYDQVLNGKRADGRIIIQK